MKIKNEGDRSYASLNIREIENQSGKAYDDVHILVHQKEELKKASERHCIECGEEIGSGCICFKCFKKQHETSMSKFIVCLLGVGILLAAGILLKIVLSIV